MTTTARVIRLNRATGEGFAEGEVKTTYNDLKPQPSGALLASSSPIHVTARSMTIHRNPAIALYTGEARLWQNANVVAAPTIEFDRNHRSIAAHGSATQPVSTVLVETGKQGQVLPDNGHFQPVDLCGCGSQGALWRGCYCQGRGFHPHLQQMDVFPQGAETNLRSDRLAGSPGIGRCGKTRPYCRSRQGGGDATHPAGNRRPAHLHGADDKFVLTGGPPSIFDAERGKITGVSLTLFRGDDRVLVEGTDTSPSVTQTRVAR